MEDLTFTCPVCGADVPRRAKSCPECGACEKSGWSEDQYLDGLDLPDMDDDLLRLPGRAGERRSRQTAAQRFWMIVGIVIVIAMAWITLRGLW
jgi:hypothetical protein